jgi:TolA-binding protein
MGCLQTRESLKEEEQSRIMQEQVSVLQKSHADSGSRFEELNADIRSLSGRIEYLEKQISDNEKAKSDSKSEKEALDKKLEIFQEALGKLETQVQTLSNELGELKSVKSQAAQAAQTVKDAVDSTNKNSKNSGIEAAEVLFKESKWKEAILSYQKYRDTHSKGKFFAEATYKTGVCFQELGMKEDAISFYEEVLAKFPSTDQAKRAKIRLKKLK